ncbi:MAG: phosphate signaling complex protein PhoU [Lachnospiraceae bacterium]|nr:phosphate signaling complex protein PhoU [Lachnospiraceae bacterium]
MRNRFDRQLKQLNDELIEMGSMIEKSIEKSVVALVTQNVEKAKDVIAFDAEIDRQEREIESLCMKLLLQQQPVARDLRLISSALKMITDMERIGDQSADIAELALMMADKPYIKDLKHISQMGQETMVMVVSSVDAFVEKDLEKAKEVLAHDDLVDDLFDEVKKELIELIHQNMENGEQATDLLMIAKYFERIGDHATNIAEWVIYSITGEHDFSSKSKENEKVM